LPCRYFIDKERRLVISTGWGHLTFAEAKALQSAVLVDPDFNPDFNQLVDVTTVGKLDISFDEAKRLAREKMFSPASQRALVATSPAVFGMMRLMGTYHELGETSSLVSVFYDVPSALAWLGLDEAAIK
jgi:hypothetical protein